MGETNQRFYNNIETAEKIILLYRNKVIGTKIYPEHSFNSIGEETNTYPLIQDVVIEKFKDKYAVVAIASDERGELKREINDLLMAKGIINKPVYF